MKKQVRQAIDNTYFHQKNHYEYYTSKIRKPVITPKIIYHILLSNFSQAMCVGLR